MALSDIESGACDALIAKKDLVYGKLWFPCKKAIVQRFGEAFSPRLRGP
jgi:hypothetical protein